MGLQLTFGKKSVLRDIKKEVRLKRMSGVSQDNIKDFIGKIEAHGGKKQLMHYGKLGYDTFKKVRREMRADTDLTKQDRAYFGKKLKELHEAKKKEESSMNVTSLSKFRKRVVEGESNDPNKLGTASSSGGILPPDNFKLAA